MVDLREAASFFIENRDWLNFLWIELTTDVIANLEGKTQHPFSLTDLWEYGDIPTIK